MFQSKFKKRSLDTNIFTLQYRLQHGLRILIEGKSHCHQHIYFRLNFAASVNPQSQIPGISFREFRSDSKSFSCLTLQTEVVPHGIPNIDVFCIPGRDVFLFRLIFLSICMSSPKQDIWNNRWLTAIVGSALWLVYFSQTAGFPTCERRDEIYPPFLSHNR